MNPLVINSLIEKISRANGTAEKELRALINDGVITKEEATVIHLRAGLHKISMSLDAILEKTAI